MISSSFDDKSHIFYGKAHSPSPLEITDIVFYRQPAIVQASLRRCGLLGWIKRIVQDPLHIGEDFRSVMGVKSST